MQKSSVRAGALILALAGCSFFEQHSQAAVIYSSDGSTYTENFDSLPNTPQNTSLGSSPIGWVDDTASPGASNFSIVGWYLYHPLSQAEGGFNGHQRVRIGAGTANTGAFMSWGASGSTERALGDLGSNTLNGTSGPGGDIYFGIRLTNSTGNVLDKVTISYDGEEWRDGGATTPAAQSMSFGYSTSTTGISDANAAYTDVPALAFSSPVFSNTGSGAAVDGNAAGKVSIGPTVINGVNWQPGTDLWLRWDDINHVGNDHGLGVDNFSFKAESIPEPGSILAIAAAAGLISTRRRRA